VARRKAYVYIRVSRGRTHRRNLEIVDQRARCQVFSRENGFRIVEEFVEIEYGKGIDDIAARPELRRCIGRAQRDAAPILVADIDRLSRNVNFLGVLIQYGATFIVTGVEAVIPPILLAPLGQSAMKPARTARFTPRCPAPEEAREPAQVKRRDFAAIAAKGRRVRMQEAKRFAVSILPEIRRIQNDGKATLRAIAAELNRRGIPTARSALWTPAAVRRVLLKADPDH